MAKQPKVLVIEDEEGVRNFVKKALADAFDVALAADGQEGLNQARWGGPDLILLDLRMPGMDGLTVLAKLKAHPQTSAIPVVIVSGQGDSTILLEGERAGAADYVIKPFDVEELRKVIRRHLAVLGD